MQVFLTTLLKCSVAMSVISLAYMIAMPFLSKRYTAKWRYYVWLVITIGWILPFRPHLDAALLPVKMPAIQFMPVEHMGTGELLMVVANETSRTSSTTLWWAIVGIWVIGVVGMIVYYAWRHWRFIKIVSRWSEDVTHSQILGILDTLKAEMEITTHVGLKTCPGIISPMMIGFFRPVVLLPSTKIASDELAFILRHELVHLKRNDLWYKALVLLATAIHWFNPVVYIMAKAIAVQCEISCDELILKGTNLQQRKQYGKAIIETVRNGAKLQTMLSTNFYGGKKDMKTRIFSIMDTTKKKAGITILCVALISIMGMGIAFASSSPKEIVETINTTNGELDESLFDISLTGVETSNKATSNMGNYSEFLTEVENDPAKYYYNDCWVRSLYDENNQNGKSIIYFNAMEDKDVVGKTAIYLKSIRNKETNEIEKLVEMSEDEAWELFGSDHDNLIHMTRTPFDEDE